MENRISFAAVFKNYAWEKNLETHTERIKTEDGMTFIVHTFLLSRQSKYFDELFSINDDGQTCALIPGIDGPILEEVLIYLYTGQIHLDDKNMIPVMIAADYLVIDTLVRKCTFFVLLNMNIMNCLDIFCAAWRIKRLANAILDKCYRFVQLHFEKVVRHSMDAVCDLPLRALKMFLGDKNLNVLGEGTVWSVIVAWIGKDPPERTALLPELFCLMSLHEVDENLTSKIVSSNLADEILSRLDLDIQKSRTALLSSKDLILDYYQKKNAGIMGRRLPSNLYFISRDLGDSNAMELFVTYDDKFDLWRKVGHLPVFNPSSFVSVRERIYIFDAGERNGEREYEGVMAFDVLTNEVIPIAPVPGEASHIVGVAGCIYAMGDIEEETNMVQRYEPVENVWRPIARMSPVIVEGVVNLNGYVCVFGRTDDYPRKLKMQIYDPSAGSWISMSGPCVCRVHVHAVVFQERLYLIGGLFEEGEYARDVEVYDPLTDTWDPFSQLPVEYIAPIAIVLKGKLYVYSFIEPSAVIYLDGQVEEWQFISASSPMINLHRYCFSVQEDPDILKEIVRKHRQLDIGWSKTSLV